MCPKVDGLSPICYVASIDLILTDEQRALMAGVAEICKRHPGEYWRQLDQERAYPESEARRIE